MNECLNTVFCDNKKYFSLVGKRGTRDYAKCSRDSHKYDNFWMGFRPFVYSERGARANNILD